MRFPFFRAKPEAEPLRTVPKPAKRARGAGPEVGSNDVNAARTRARERLVGALVLLLVGVLGFPVLFETQPRPLPLDISIQIAAREGAEAATPATLYRPLPVTTLPADAGSEVLLMPQAASATSSGPAVAEPAPSVPAVAVAPPRPAAVEPQRAAASAPARPAVAAPAPAPLAATPATPAAAVRTESARSESARAAALLAGGGSVATSVPAAAGRFVVQVGAYTDARTLKDARAKVEKLGLQTYTQVIEGDAGKRTRVRLGPYATRAEAETAAEKLKRAGLPANILSL